MTSLVRAENMPTMHSALWTPEDGSTVEIPFALTQENECPEAIFFTGFGEVDTRRIARDLGSLGLNLAVTNLCIPTKGRKTVADEYRADIASSIAAVRRDVLQTVCLPPETKLGVVGNSGGAGEAIVGVGRNPHQWRWAMLLSPLGGAIQSVREIKRGLAKEAERHPPLTEVFLGRELAEKFLAGMILFSDSDGPEEIKRLARELPLVVVIAEKDRVIPSAQTVYSLGGVALAWMEGMEHISCLGNGAADTAGAYKVGWNIMEGLLAVQRVK